MTGRRDYGVLYLLFNEGYSATAGSDLIRQNLSAEAIRLGRVLVRLMPSEPETAGLLALMVMHDARRAARLDPAGDLVTLEDQDRSRWDSAEIGEGVSVLEAALGQRQPGPYQIQAAIAACHVTAARAADTDWAQIARLYEQLARFLPTPVVALNHAVAVGLAEGPQPGLDLVTALETGGLARLLPAARDQGGHVPAPGPGQRRGGLLPGGAGAGRHRRRAALPQPPPGRNQSRLRREPHQCHIGVVGTTPMSHRRG